MFQKIKAISLAVTVSFMFTPMAFAGQLASAMDQYVYLDSQSWMFNRYNRGSMHNVQVLSRNKKTNSGTVYGEYLYNGNQVGWVKIAFNNGNVQCIEFHDFAGNCRPLGRSPSSQIVMGLIVQGMVGSPGGQRSRSQAAQDFDDDLRSFRQNQMENGQK